MSFDNRPKAPATAEERNKMAIKILESADYKDDELGQCLVSLIRKGLVYVYPDGKIEITEEGERAVEKGQWI